MSSESDAAAAAALAIYTELYTTSYCGAAAAVLFFYDSFVTFDREVACFWSARRTGGSLLFYANKWITMTVFIMMLASYASFPSDKVTKHCTWFYRAEFAIGELQSVPGAAFSALRAFVLSRSKLLGLLIFALSLAQVGANLVLYAYIYGERFPLFGCIETGYTSAALDLRSGSFTLVTYIVADFVQRLVIIARVPLIIADILLIYINWTRLSGSWDALRNIRPSKRLSLSDILFHGGNIYFVVLTILNILHLVLSVAATTTSDGRSSYVIVFTSPITAILISRFLLELQEASQMVVRIDSDDPLHSVRNPDDTPSFISSLGGFVNPGNLSAHSDEDGDVELQQLSEEPPEEIHENEGRVRARSPQVAILSSSA